MGFVHLVLTLHVPGAEAQLGTTGREQVQGRDLAGQQGGVPEPGVEHVGTQPEPGTDRAGSSERGERGQPTEMVRRRQHITTELISPLHQLPEVRPGRDGVQVHSELDLAHHPRITRGSYTGQPRSLLAETCCPTIHPGRAAVQTQTPVGRDEHDFCHPVLSTSENDNGVSSGHVSVPRM